jgi:ATP-dependent helicase HrpB
VLRAPLPIDAHLPAIARCVAERGALVLVAPPGSGKTTRVPGALVDRGLAGEIVVLEPRRLAARAAARRVAAERGGALGDEVGYQVRHDRQAGPRTRIRFVTEGVLVRRIVADPLLAGIGAVVLDEFHERHLEGDLALAMLAEVRATVRPDLALVVMSATLDVEPLRRFLGDCPLLAVDVPVHPVRVEYEERVASGALVERVRSAVARAWRETASDVLVFLPGVREIEQARRALVAARGDAAVLALHGRLTAAEQDRAVAADATQRRIVLATNIAESSLTIEGVSAVVDSGLARVLRHDPARGIDTLRQERISKASAAQRSGRAGRLGPGVCYRLWTAPEARAMPAFQAPDVHRVDVAGAVLQVVAFAGRSAAAFGWFDPPPPAALQRAEALLRALGAVDDAGLTALGRQMLALPLHPRLARVMVEARRRGCAHAAAGAAALLSERDIVRARTGEAGVDLHPRLALLHGEGALADVDRGALAAVRRARDQIAGRARPRTVADEDLLCSLLAGFPDRVALRRGVQSRDAVMVGGRALQLPSASPELGELFLALQVGDVADRRAAARVFLAAGLQRDWLDAVFPGALAWRDDAELDGERGRVRALRRLYFHDLVLEEHAGGAAPRDAARELLTGELARDPWAHLGRQDELRAFLARLRWLRAHQPSLPLPEVDDALVAQAAAALLTGRSLGELDGAPVLGALLGLLPPGTRALVDRAAPARVKLPAGREVRIDYAAQAGPTVAARIQDFFGLQTTPQIARGVPLVLELLAPNRRPVQVTRDLPSFWNEVYPRVRLELRRRYPKHAWPEDPRRGP